MGGPAVGIAQVPGPIKTSANQSQPVRPKAEYLTELENRKTTTLLDTMKPGLATG
jgi:hypothetical protein